MDSLTGQHGLKQMRVADLLDPTNRAFFFQAVDHGLNRGVRRPVLLREAFLNLPHGAGSQVPQLFKQLKFETADAAFRHSYSCRLLYYSVSR